MILEEETFEAFGYYPIDLKLKSAKRILAACNDCGKVRTTSKHDYHALCKSCANKGKNNPMFNKHHTEKTKAKMSAINVGRRHTEESKILMSVVHKGIIFTEEHKAKLSAAGKGKTFTEEWKANIGAALKGENHHNFGKRGAECGNYKGGKTATHRRQAIKRGLLGYTLLMPLAEGEVGHHVTDKHVMGIPADVHNSIGGRRRNHRARVLQWLKANDKRKYKMVLCVLAKQ